MYLGQGQRLFVVSVSIRSLDSALQIPRDLSHSLALCLRESSSSGFPWVSHVECAWECVWAAVLLCSGFKFIQWSVV